MENHTQIRCAKRGGHLIEILENCCAFGISSFLKDIFLHLQQTTLSHRAPDTSQLWPHLRTKCSLRCHRREKIAQVQCALRSKKSMPNMVCLIAVGYYLVILKEFECTPWFPRCGFAFFYSRSDISMLTRCFQFHPSKLHIHSSTCWRRHLQVTRNNASPIWSVGARSWAVRNGSSLLCTKHRRITFFTFRGELALAVHRCCVEVGVF